MTQYALILSRRAIADLDAVEAYVLKLTQSQAMTDAYMNRLFTRLKRQTSAPHQGTRRDELRPGVRVTSFEHSVAIVFRVKDDVVRILALAHHGREYEAGL